MKSVTIKDPKTGRKLIKVSHTKKGYFLEAAADLGKFECLIVTDTNERVLFPAKVK